MNLIKALAKTAAVVAVSWTLATGTVAQTTDTGFEDERAEKRLRVREHILWSIGTSLDKLYWWDGFGKEAAWDTVRWRKWELEQRSYRHLVDTYTHLKRMDYLYGVNFISIKELAEEYFGELQWTQARFRPAFHDRNEPFFVGTPDGIITVWTGAETYVDFYGPRYDVWRLDTMFRRIVEDANWLGVDLTWLETYVAPFRRFYDNFLGEAIALEELEHAGVINSDERRRHFTGDRRANDVYFPAED